MLALIAKSDESLRGPPIDIKKVARAEPPPEGTVANPEVPKDSGCIRLAPALSYHHVGEVDVLFGP